MKKITYKNFVNTCTDCGFCVKMENQNITKNTDKIYIDTSNYTRENAFPGYLVAKYTASNSTIIGWMKNKNGTIITECDDKCGFVKTSENERTIYTDIKEFKKDLCEFAEKMRYARLEYIKEKIKNI